MPASEPAYLSRDPALTRAGALDLDTTWPNVPHVHGARFSLGSLMGRLVELTAPGGSALLTAAAALVLEAQGHREPAAWVSTGASVVYPPDLDASGIDLAALPIIRVRGAITAARAADELLRSGGFGLVVIDLTCTDGIHASVPNWGGTGRSRALRASGPVVPLPIQTRLSGLAHKHHAALVCLTRKSDAAPSLGSLVTLRARADTLRTGFSRFTWALDVVKDKRSGPGWQHEETRRGPEGLV